MRHGILKVTEKASQEIEASAVKLEIMIEGSSIFYGNAALDKSVELKEFIKKLEPYKEALTLSINSISIKSDSGWLSKSSKGVYRVSMQVNKLDHLNDLFGLIADSKNIQLIEMNWIFAEEDIKLELIKQAVVKAKNKASAMMSVIDYQVVGIRTCSDSYESPALDPINPLASANLDQSTLLRSRRALSSTIDLGTQIISRKEVSCISTIEFYVEPLSA